MANHQFACLAPETANDGRFLEISQVDSRHSGFSRQKSAMFTTNLRFSFGLLSA
jgi:hypothetical protein